MVSGAWVLADDPEGPVPGVKPLMGVEKAERPLSILVLGGTGFIVGPDDYSRRFTYWPVRASRGGEMLAPGTPDDPIQIIDVRDLAKWLVNLAEKKTMGHFDALGPNHKALTMGRLFEASKTPGRSDVTFTWVPADFLEARQVSAGGDLPIWIPPIGDAAGFHQRNVAKAEAAGLTFRPIEETCRDTLAWWTSLPEGERRKRLSAMPAEREQEVLAAWKASQGGEAKAPAAPSKTGGT